MTPRYSNFFVFLDDISSRIKGIANLNKLFCTGPCKSIYNVNKVFVNCKSNFVSPSRVISTSTKRIFDCLVSNGTTYTGCNYSNVSNHLQQILFAVCWKNYSEIEKKVQMT